MKKLYILRFPSRTLSKAGASINTKNVGYA